MLRNNFTLLELLVIVGIFGILISILLPSLRSAREKTRRAICMSNQQQIFRAQLMFSKDENGKFPMGTLGQYQFNYVIWRKKYFANFGELYKRGYFGQPQLKYKNDGSLSNHQSITDFGPLSKQTM